jgi:hypothetical protein
VVFAQWAFCAFTVQICMQVMCEHWAYMQSMHASNMWVLCYAVPLTLCRLRP